MRVWRRLRGWWRAFTHLPLDEYRSDLPSDERWHRTNPPRPLP